MEKPEESKLFIYFKRSNKIKDVFFREDISIEKRKKAAKLLVKALAVLKEEILKIRGVHK